MNRKTGEDVVIYEIACDRIRKALRGCNSPVLTSQIGDAIWPEHSMTRQGSALAASKFTSRMRYDGILRYVIREHTRGMGVGVGGTRLHTIQNQPAWLVLFFRKTLPVAKR